MYTHRSSFDIRAGFHATFNALHNDSCHLSHVTCQIGYVPNYPVASSQGLGSAASTIASVQPCAKSQELGAELTCMMTMTVNVVVG